MNRSDYYSYSPEWVGIGYRPNNPIGKLPLAPGCEEYKPPHKDGFMIDNNARLDYTAVFNFIYDEHVKLPTEVRVNVGDRISITFNEGKQGQVRIATMRGIVTKIQPIKDTNKFVITLDASTPNNSCVMNIGSRVILDIVKLNKDEDIDDKSNTVEEIIDDSYDVEIIKPPHHHEHHTPPMPPRPEHCDHVPPTMHSNHIDWMKLEIDKDEDRGYNVLNITYAKKDPVDVLLCICDRAGNVLHKALDTSKRISMGSNFTWTFRNYIKEVNKLSTIEKLQNYTVDSVANYVMLERDKDNEYIKAIEESSLTFIENLNVVVQLVTGPNLLMYNPLMNCKHRGYEVESKFYNITPEILLGAVKPEEEPPKEDDPKPPVNPPKEDPVIPPSGDDDNTGDNKPDEDLNLAIFNLDKETNTYSLHDGKYTGLTYKDEGTYTKTEDDGSYTIIKDNLVDTCIVTNIKYNIPAMFSMRARAIDVNSNNDITVTVTSFKYNEEGEVTYDEPEIEDPKYNTKIFILNEANNTLSFKDNTIVGLTYISDGIYTKSIDEGFILIKDNEEDKVGMIIMVDDNNAVIDIDEFTYDDEGNITYTPKELSYNEKILILDEENLTFSLKDGSITGLVQIDEYSYSKVNNDDSFTVLRDDLTGQFYITTVDEDNVVEIAQYTYDDEGNIEYVEPDIEWNTTIFKLNEEDNTLSLKDDSITGLVFNGDGIYLLNDIGYSIMIKDDEVDTFITIETVYEDNTVTVQEYNYDSEGNITLIKPDIEWNETIFVLDEEDNTLSLKNNAVTGLSYISDGLYTTLNEDGSSIFIIDDMSGEFSITTVDTDIPTVTEHYSYDEEGNIEYIAPEDPEPTVPDYNETIFVLDEEDNTFSLKDNSITGLSYLSNGVYVKTDEDGGYTIIKDNLVDGGTIISSIATTKFTYDDEGNISYVIPEPEYNTTILVLDEETNTLSLKDGSITGLVYIDDGIYTVAENDTSTSYFILRDDEVDSFTVTTINDGSIISIKEYTYTDEGIITEVIPEPIELEYNTTIFVLDEETNTLSLKDNSITGLVYTDEGIYVKNNEDESSIIIKDNLIDLITVININIEETIIKEYNYDETGTLTEVVAEDPEPTIPESTEPEWNTIIFKLNEEDNTLSLKNDSITGLVYVYDDLYTKSNTDGSMTLVIDNGTDSFVVNTILDNVSTIKNYSYTDEGIITEVIPEPEEPEYNTTIFVANESDNTLSLKDNSIIGVIYLGDGVYSKSTEDSYTIIKDNLVDTCTVYNSSADNTTFTYDNEGTITYIVPEVPEPIIPDYNSTIFNYDEEVNTLNMTDGRYTNLLYIGNNVYSGFDRKGNIINIYDDKEYKTGYINFIDTNGNPLYSTTFTYTEDGTIKHKWPEWYKDIPPETEWFCKLNYSGNYDCVDQDVLPYTFLQYLGDNQYRTTNSASQYYILTLMGNGICKVDKYSKSSSTAEPILNNTKYVGYIYKCTNYNNDSTKIWSWSSRKQNINTQIFTQNDTYKAYDNCYKHNTLLYMDRAEHIGNGVYIHINEPNSDNSRNIYISVDDFKGMIHNATLTLDSNNNISGLDNKSTNEYGIRGDISIYE